MRSLTKSSLAFARVAMAVAARQLPPYSHPFSPRKFTQHQLFAILALKQFLRTDYRGVISMLSEWSELRQVLSLAGLPHYSTLCYAEKRLLKKTPLQDFSQAPSNLPAAAGSCRRSPGAPR